MDKWMEYYNSERAHSGRYCFGKTPTQTFLASKAVAKSKNMTELFDKSNNFMMSEKAETSSAAEQLVRNTLNDENDKVAVSFPALLPKIVF